MGSLHGTLRKSHPCCFWTSQKDLGAGTLEGFLEEVTFGWSSIRRGGSPRWKDGEEGGEVEPACTKPRETGCAEAAAAEGGREDTGVHPLQEMPQWCHL